MLRAALHSPSSTGLSVVDELARYMRGERESGEHMRTWKAWQCVVFFKRDISSVTCMNEPTVFLVFAVW